MSISWTTPALRDVEEAVRYLQREDAGLAQMIADRIFAGVSILERFSCAGKLGRVAETREMRIRDTPYILIYEIGAEGPVICAFCMSVANGRATRVKQTGFPA
ncbi:type II toxin-antitoxin system RelE/ParE family toxin [Nitratidesulfovibrio sp. 1201_IL3209]|uniref:type II toxin-antitoxin system RelE/ParE family toxin n=1 Tax=Nitratidesulfovibrio sp. 1201_IL3209 TaxID=3084053 RepID=UPI003FA5FA22